MSIALIEKYFPKINSTQKEQFEQLVPLYADWNSKINVVSRKDIDSLMEKHVLHSLAISLFFDLNKGQKILDIGTGGGFPGVPLAILNPKSNFTLIDSIGKKIKVVNGVCESLKLKNCKGIHENAKNHRSEYDTVVSRAVTAFDSFVDYTKPLLKPNKTSEILYLKGGDLSLELSNVVNKVKIYDLKTKIDTEFFETKKIVQYRPFSQLKKDSKKIK